MIEDRDGTMDGARDGPNSGLWAILSSLFCFTKSSGAYDVF